MYFKKYAQDTTEEVYANHMAVFFLIIPFSIQFFFEQMLALVTNEKFN